MAIFGGASVYFWAYSAGVIQLKDESGQLSLYSLRHASIKNQQGTA